MGVVDELGRLGEHLGLVLAAEIYSVADACDVEGGALLDVHDLVDGVELLGEGVLLGGLDEMGLRVHLHEVGDVRVVHPVAVDESNLGREDPYSALVCDTEEVFGVGVVFGDALAVEVVVHVLEFLVSCKEHEVTGILRDGEVILQICRLCGLGHIEGNDDFKLLCHTQSFQ